MQGMKKVVTGMVVGASVVLLGAGGAMAGGNGQVNAKIPGLGTLGAKGGTTTSVTNSTIVNSSTVSGGKNTATGTGSVAVSGSNVIQNGATVDNSKIVNSSTVSGGKNTASEGGTAASGSTIIQ